MFGARFPSKMDWWLLALIGLSLFGAVIAGVAVLSQGNPEGYALFAIPVFTLLMVFPCFYQVRDEILYVRSGIIRYKVDLDKIDRVSPSRSLLSGPALSIDRMLVEAGKYKLLISPNDKVGFLQELQAYAPQLRFVDELELKRS